MNMRLLFLTSNFPRFSGDYAGNFILYLVEALEHMGHEIIVVAPHYPGSMKKEVINNIKVRRFQYVYPSTQQRLAYGRFAQKMNIATALQLIPYCFCMLLHGITAIKELDVDIIISFWTFPQGLIGILLKSLFRIPAATRVQSSDFIAARKIGPFMTSVMSMILRKSNIVIPNSDYTGKYIPDRLELQEKTFTVREGFRITGSIKEKEPITAKIKLLTVTRLIERKGIRFLIQAMKNVTVNNPHVKLVIVGEGPDHSTFEKLTRQLELQENIVFAGRVSDQELKEHYTTSHIFILPSTEEALGVVLLEAMYHSLPIVASNVGGVPEIVTNQETGILTAPGNPKELSQAIKSLIESPEKRRYYSERGRRHVLENFTWEKIAAAFELIIKTTL